MVGTHRLTHSQSSTSRPPGQAGQRSTGRTQSYSRDSRACTGRTPRTTAVLRGTQATGFLNRVRWFDSDRHELARITVFSRPRWPYDYHAAGTRRTRGSITQPGRVGDNDHNELCGPSVRPAPLPVDLGANRGGRGRPGPTPPQMRPGRTRPPAFPFSSRSASSCKPGGPNTTVPCLSRRRCLVRRHHSRRERYLVSDESTRVPCC